MITKRFAAMLLVSALLPFTAARADNYPSRVVTIVVPYPAGSLGDLLPRAMAEVLQAQTGQTFVIDNKHGASQMIGARIAQQARPDGYTLFFGSVTSLAINPAVKKSLPYDPVKDFEPISLTFTSPMYIVSRRDLGVGSLADLIALAKRQPGKLSYASGGHGSSSHLAGELLKTKAGIDLVHVPYSGTGPAIRDVIGGHVDLTFTASGLGYANDGQVKLLASTGLRRAEAAPDLQTVTEAGIANFEATSWFGFLAPAGTPKPIIDKLAAEMRKAIASNALKEKLKTTNEIELVGTTPDEFRDFIAREIPKWRDVVRAANIPAD